MSLPIARATDSLTLIPEADAYVDSDSQLVNYGNSSSLYVDFWDWALIEDERRNSYLLFNFTSLYTDVFAINSATLQLRSYHTGSPNCQVGVHSCPDTQWSEIEITWENAPSFSPEPIDVETIARDIWYSWNVTEEVINSQEGYLTLVLTCEDEGTQFTPRFSSKDSSIYQPRLELQYTIIPEFPSWLILPLFLTATILALTVRRRIKR